MVPQYTRGGVRVLAGIGLKGDGGCKVVFACFW
jgi:hypothetical protein